MHNKPDNTLFDTLIKENRRLRNDAGLSRALGVAPPVVSKIRNGHMLLGDTMRVNIMRRFNMSMTRMDELAPPTGVMK